MKLFLVFCFLLFTSFLFAARTDIVILRNGDRITGEIKELKYGKLKYKTEDAGTIYIEWENIDQIYSMNNFELITVSGTKYFGSISFSESRKLRIFSPAGFIKLYLFEIVTIIPIKSGFWKKLDGNINLGFNYTKASELSQGNAELNLYYNTYKYNHVVKYSNLITIQKDNDDAIRQDALYSITKLLENKWLWISGVNWQQNSELGILSRYSVYSQYGKFLLYSSKTALKLNAGVLVNNETSFEGKSDGNIEASFSLNYDFFSYDSPKLTVSAHYILFPSLTIKNRIRQDLSTEIKWKIFSDFTFSFKVYFNADNKPITVGAAKEDWGMVTSIGYTF